MPGFQYTLASRDVDQVIAFLKTVPTPTAPAKPAAAPRANQREDD